MTTSRIFCPRCAIKHLGQAWVLQKEAPKGYPDHYWLALGHMAEAEDELVAGIEGEDSPGAEAVNEIRRCRKAWEDFPPHRVDFGGLINFVAERMGLIPDFTREEK